MFGFNSKALKECEEILRNRLDEITELEDSIADKDIEIERLKLKLDELTKAAANTVVNSPMVVDFAKMKAFSIERLCDEHTRDVPVTIIGYILPNGTDIGEWNLNCSQATHNALVKKFVEYSNVKTT